MARCEDCLHFEVCEALEQGNGLMKVPPIHCGCYKNAADVVPKSEVERLQNILDSYALQYGTVMDKHIVIERARAEEAKQVLSDLKKQVHDKATYPHNSGIDPYMSLKMFDAILNNIIKKYSEVYHEN